MKFTNYEEMMWFFGNDPSQGLKAKDLSCEKFNTNRDPHHQAI